MRILMIYPPCSMPDKPYISLPALSGYLKSKGVEVHVLDANIEFYHRFLSYDHVLFARRFAEARLAALNAEAEPGAQESAEYKLLANALPTCPVTEESVSGLFGDGPLSNVERVRLHRDAIAIANAPYYPERLDYNISTGYIRYVSRSRKFSSQSIMRSLEEPTLFSGFLEGILFPVLTEDDFPVVGISVIFPDQILPAMQCAKIIKEHNPNACIVFGGPFVSTHMRRIREPALFKYVDGFILDEGEIPLERLIGEVSSSQPDLRRVPGLVYMSGGEIVANAPVPPPDMECLPPVDYSGFPLDRYLMPRSRMSLLFRLSRGCYWGRCSFCKTELSFIKNHQQPTADRLYRHLRALVGETGVRVVLFTDDSASPEILEDLSQRMIADQLNIRWTANLRIDRRLTLERLLLFRQAGCYSIYVGLESCNDRILKLMKKGTTEQGIRNTLMNISWSGLKAVAYMIVGFPTETEEEALSSFEKVKGFVREGALADCIYNVFELTPYSQIFLDPEKYGITKVATDPHFDLTPPTTNFEAPGMSRERASELCLSFIRQLKGNAAP